MREDPRLLDGLSRSLLAVGAADEAIEVLVRLLEILDGQDQARLKVADVERRRAEAKALQ